MEKLYTKMEHGNYRPTQLHKDLGVEVGNTINKLFDELVDSGLDFIEAKYLIESCTYETLLNKLLVL